jgi:glycosyltransferase involved in cell wall biosynthesis
MRILFLTHAYPNYVPDLLLHGLRKLIGPDVVDFPRKDCLYHGVLGLGVCPQDQLCPGWFPKDNGMIDRQEVWRKAHRGHFHLIVCDVRALASVAPQLNGYTGPLAVIDGEDTPQTLPPGNYVVFRRETDGADFSIPLPMALPEEVLKWITHYDFLPKKFSIGFLGSTHDGERKRCVEQLARWYPDALFQATGIPSKENPAPSGRMSRDTYYRTLQQCRFVLTLPGAGLDTFRFWENTACNSVHASARMPLFIPNDFLEGRHLIRFDDLNELRSKIDDILNNPGLEKMMKDQAREHLTRHHLTTRRAVYFLDKTTRFFGRFPHHVTTGSISSKSADEGNSTANPSPDSSTATRQTVYLGLVKGDNYGWGVCSRYLIETLSRDIDVHVLHEEDGSARCANLDGKLFQGLANHEFTPLFPAASGVLNYGYTFFENELTRNSIENAKRFDIVLGGSSWCRDRMMEKGIQHCDVLIQGIDSRLFYPVQGTTPDDRFVIFSGGKFELRKGQDLVLRAVKILQEKYSDIWLVNCWYNLWPASTRLMAFSRHIQFKYRENESWRECMQRTYAMNGLDADRIITHELVPHEQQRNLFAGSDIGVFPNRCEGGTNLVMMEYMACAKPVIASNTSGHRDILTENNALCLNTLSDFNVNNINGKLIARWQEASLDELIERIEYAYHHRNEIKALGQRAGEDLKQFTWEHTARQLRQVMRV